MTPQVPHSTTPVQLRQLELLRTLNLISPWQAVGAKKIRVGSDFDGGYVLLGDVFSAKVCYSLGIGGNADWDLLMAQTGCLVHQYDHTIDSPPIMHANFRFNKLGIAPNDNWSPAVKQLDTLMATNGDTQTQEMILKMDIEGNEWTCLDTLSSSTIGQFRQIVCEFHNLRLLQDNEEFAQRAKRVFEKLFATHRVVHVHGNNNAPFYVIEGIPLPDVFELTLANIRNYKFEESREIFPTPLDQPCTPALPDLFLGTFQFISD